jgi:hypothetical protein
MLTESCQSRLKRNRGLKQPRNANILNDRRQGDVKIFENFIRIVTNASFGGQSASGDNRGAKSFMNEGAEERNDRLLLRTSSSSAEKTFP